MPSCLRSLLVFLAAVWIIPVHSYAQFVPIPPLSSPIIDQTGVLGAEASSLEQEVRTLKAERGSEVAVLIVPSTKPETIEQYSIRVVDQWGLGRKGVDDGVLLVVALRDRTVRIEVGRGLEGQVTDLRSHRIIDELILPMFRKGDIPGGVRAGVEALIASLKGMELPEPKQRKDSNFPALLIAFTFALVWGRAISALTGQLGGAIVAGGALFVFGSVLTSVLAGAIAATICATLILLLPSVPALAMPRTRYSTRRASRQGRRGPSEQQRSTNTETWGGGLFGGSSSGISGSFGGGGTFSGGGASGRW
jgi:uncharacterized protein